MIDFPLSLALFNFVPVVLAGAGVWLLARLVGDQDPQRGTLALAGAGLILIGGLAKATWKLVASATGTDLAWLGNALFPLMAPGFALLSVSLLGASRRMARRNSPAWPVWVAIGAISAAFVAAGLRTWVWEIPRGWLLPLLALASVCNLVLSALAIAAALRLRKPWVAALFAVNLAMIFALQPIAVAPTKTLAMHWTEQSLTALGTACFALGALLLRKLAAERTGIAQPARSKPSAIRP
jgi:hypothetical protein